MPLARKNTSKKTIKKRTPSSTTVVVKARISAKDTLFSEKVTAAKKILHNTQGL